MSNGQSTQRQGIFYGWRIVGASMICISTGPGPFGFAALGLFIIPFGTEFGWGRDDITLCSMLFVAATALSLPYIGRLVDRWGSLVVLLPSMIFMGVSLAAIPAFVSELWQLLAVFLIIGTLGAGTNSVPYMPVLGAWFFKKRGLAIGVAMAGIGVGYFYVPLLVQYLIDNVGWRSGYYALSAIVLFVALPIAFLFIKESPAAKGMMPDGEVGGEIAKGADKSVGYTVSQILRRREFWILSGVFAVLSFVLNGMLTHLVPMLIDRGMSTSSAAWVAATEGAMIVVSRPLIGFIIDKYFAPYVAMFFFALSAVGIGIFAGGAVDAMAFFAVILVGLSLGAEVDLLAYLAGRYFGMRAFGSAYGMLFAASLVGTAIGPYVFALGYESTGSYVGILTACVTINIVAIVLTAFLGRYPDWDELAAKNTADA